MHLKQRETTFSPQRTFWVFCIALFIFTIGGLSFFGEKWGVGALFNRWGWLSLTEVHVETSWPLTPDIIKSWLPELKGTNLLFLKMEPVLSQLRTKAWVKEISVRKQYPNQLFLQVLPKEPIAVALLGGTAHFVDSEGQWIDRALPAVLREKELPLFSWNLEPGKSGWNIQQMLDTLPQIQKKLGKNFSISEVVFESFPYFKVFLASHRLEIDLSWDEWDSEIDRLLHLLHFPLAIPARVGRINLTISKKAVVSSPLSN